jgi:hypothetical protein
MHQYAKTIVSSEAGYCPPHARESRSAGGSPPLNVDFQVGGVRNKKSAAILTIAAL